MSESLLPMLQEAAQAPGLLKQIYGDLAKPGVSQVGKALSTVLGLGNTILWPLSLLNEKAKITLEHNLEKYRKQLEVIPEEKIIPVAPEIGVPVTEKLSYVNDDELSNLYVNLLARASTKDSVSAAHPSFVNIINNLSPDEAVLLRAMSGGFPFPFVTARWVLPSREFTEVGDLLTDINDKAKLSFKENINAYFSNFEGLGLIQIRRDIMVVPITRYKQLEKMFKPFAQERKPSDSENRQLRFEKGRIDITSFGGLFLSSCLKKLNET